MSVDVPDERQPLLPGHSIGLDLEPNVSGLAAWIVQLAITVVAGVDEASVTLVGPSEQLANAAASSPTVLELDTLQHQSEEGGPVVECIRTDDEIAVSIPSRRWTSFDELATRTGVLAVRSLPLRMSGIAAGALNLYTTSRPDHGGRVDRVAPMLADHTAVLIANASALASAEVANAHLRQALETRDLIGQAKGILMARQGISSDQAFDILRRGSQRTNRKLKDLAVEVIDRHDQRGGPKRPG
jgi:hypothetical protein